MSEQKTQVEQQITLTEFRRARELGILPWSHLSNPTQRFEVARNTIDYLLSLLQPPVASERCGECGHDEGVNEAGYCNTKVLVPESAATMAPKYRDCLCKCVFATTGPTSELISRDDVVKCIERQIRLWDDDTVMMACADMLADIIVAEFGGE